MEHEARRRGILRAAWTAKDARAGQERMLRTLSNPRKPAIANFQPMGAVPGIRVRVVGPIAWLRPKALGWMTLTAYHPFYPSTSASLCHNVRLNFDRFPFGFRAAFEDL